MEHNPVNPVITELNFHSFTQTLRKTVNEIFHELGRGYPKEIYENALKYELQQQSISFEFHKALPIKYKTQECGCLICDFYLPNENLIVNVHADSKEPNLKNLQQAKHQMSAYLKSEEQESSHQISSIIVNFGSPYINQRAEPDFIILTHV
jgi:GxxExxY protein